ncbi:MAG: cobalamin-dependent protein [Bacteroidales bacterium]|nr:cobalamin-dependent protein [Bacteroidales bacterium]
MHNLALLSNQLERAILSLNREDAESIIREASGKNSLSHVSEQLVSLTLQRIGEAWEDGRLSLSQVYMSGVICEEIIDQITQLENIPKKDHPKMAIGVFEDFHMLGKRIIYSTLKSCGFELMDLGGGLSIEKLVDTVQKENIKILLLSVLMLPSALHIKSLKEKLAETDVKIIVGGAPFRFDDRLWIEVGADPTGKDTAEAIALVEKFIEKTS